ncbi:MAG: c-type cytochrome [Myxococcaceae bacterium]
MIAAGALLLLSLTHAVPEQPLCEPSRSHRRVSGFEATSSTVAKDPLGRGVWVVDAERDEVAIVPDVGEPRRFPVGKGPSELVVDDEGRAYVSCAAAGTISVVDVNGDGLELPVGTEPRSMAIDTLSHELFVGIAGDKAVARVNLDTMKVEAQKDVGVRPDHVALTPQGIAVLPRADDAAYFTDIDSREAPMRVPFTGGVRLIGTMGLNTVQSVFGGGGARRQWHGQALVPVGDGVFVIHSTVEPNADENGFGRGSEGGGTYGGGTSLPISTVATFIPFDSYEPSRSSILMGGAEVTGAAANGKYLVIVDRNSQSVLLMPRFANGVSNARATAVVGSGLQGAAVDADGSVVTYAAFDRKVERVADLTSHSGSQIKLQVIAERSLGDTGLDLELQQGRELFFTATTRTSSFGVSCANCHVDGREDGLVWSVDGDRRQTPMLAGRLHDTAPFGWTGDSKTVEANIQRTIKRLGGTGITAKEEKALARFITEALPPPPVPPSHEDPALVAQGSKVFHENAGCADCHEGKAYTDGKNYKLYGSQNARVDPARKREMNTPSLKFVAMTAPYLHDGSVSSLEQIVSDAHDSMGSTKDLNADQRKALVAYLKTL